MPLRHVIKLHAIPVGGIAYISYNCLPGWASVMPLRHVMKLHAEIMGSEFAGIVPCPLAYPGHGPAFVPSFPCVAVDPRCVVTSRDQFQKVAGLFNSCDSTICEA